MTPRARLSAVLRREVPDTVPIFLRGVSPFGENMNWMGRFDGSYERLRRLAFEKTDIFHGAGFDCGVFLSGADIPVTTSVISENTDWQDMGTKVETPLGPLRKVVRHSTHNLYDVMEVEFYIKDEGDYERFMSIPFEPVRPAVQPTMTEKDREVGEKGLTVVGIPSPVGITHELLGSEGLALWSVLHRGKVLAILKEMSRRLLDYVAYLLEQGAGPVFSYGGPELALPPLMSPRDFRDFVTDIDRPVHELIHSYGRYTWVHCHGTLDKALEQFVEIGVDILEPVEAPPGGDVELADVKRRIGDKVILMGNMPYEALISWPTPRIEARVKADCAAAMARGGYIMMPAASPFEPVLTDRGFEGYTAYVESGRKYGRYG
jgi:hypothetical protein